MILRSPSVPVAFVACLVVLYTITAQGSVDTFNAKPIDSRVANKGTISAESVASGAQRNKPTNQQDVVAIFDGREITVTQLDASIRLQLHELDLAQYELRLKYLKRLIADQTRISKGASSESINKTGVVSTDTKILLEPPLPPRFEVETGDNDVRGNPGAPVTIIEFLDFQSPHSSKTEPVLHELLEDYGPLVRLIVRDMPLQYHRQAKRAAEAAECARKPGKYWRYHDLLLQNQNKLAPSDLLDYAVTSGLDRKRFEACLASPNASKAVQEDIAAAHRLGLFSAPTFFINGLYLRGPRKYSDFARLINRELVGLDFLKEPVVNSMGSDQSPFRQAHRSNLSLTLTGTVTQENPIDSAAVLYNEASRSEQTLKIRETILEDVELVLVTHDRAYLQRGERLEFLALSSPPEGDTASKQNDMPSFVPDAVLTLQRAEIAKALEAGDRLDDSFKNGAMDIEGKRLLKLAEVAPGSLFELLGLQVKDVLMQVDGDWIYNRHNPLWNALRTRNKVNLVIMRKGFPKRFQYVINGDPN